MIKWIYVDNKAIDATRPVMADIDITDRFLTIEIKDNAVRDLGFRIKLEDIKQLLEHNTNG